MTGSDVCSSDLVCVCVCVCTLICVIVWPSCVGWEGDVYHREGMKEMSGREPACGSLHSV